MPRAMLNAPYSQFFDDNGTPLNGGKVYTYLAGTLTPQATYTAITGSSVNANPVVLDSAGRAEIWLDGSYYLKVTDSLDNLIRDADNVASPAGSGNMSTGTYDPAGIVQQVVGTSATQTLLNKTLTNPTISGQCGKVVLFTYDVSTASATQTVSSVGFTPTNVDFTYQFTSGGNANLLGWGSGDVTTNATFYNSTSSFVPSYLGTTAITGEITASSHARATVSSFTSDGCVLNWTKTSTPTGTLTVIARFYRR